MNEAHIKQLAHDIGINLCGVTDKLRYPEVEEAIDVWVGKNFIPQRYGKFPHEKKKFSRLDEKYPWARSIIACAMSYNEDNEVEVNGPYGEIAKYTQRNYYAYLRNLMETLGAKIQEESGKNYRFNIYTCYNNLPEKAIAVATGIVSYAKNGTVMEKQFGSYTILGEIITDLPIELENKTPMKNLCGSCRICIEACPTGALHEEYKVNIPRCYQFISENETEIIEPDKWGKKFYGCTICLDVCPITKRSQQVTTNATTGVVGNKIELARFFDMNEENFKEYFKDNQISMRTHKAILKNAELCKKYF